MKPDARAPLSTETTAAGGREPPRDVIDVDALMADLRRRVAEKKARGLYTVDALVTEAAETDEPWRVEELERLRALSVQRVDLDTAASTKPMVGGLVSKVKRTLVRGTSQPMYTMAAQANAFHGPLLGYLSQLAREVSALGRQVEAAQGRTEEVAARMRESELELQRDAGQLAGRLEELADAIAALAEAAAARDSRLEALRDAALPERVTRLEHGPPDAVAPPARHHVPPVGDPARLRREARDHDARDEARYAAHGAALGAEGPLLHLGAGSGRGLAHLGPGAEGVEADAELVGAAVREGRPVRLADPVAAVAALAPGSLGGVLVSDLVERLDGGGLQTLAAALARAVRPGGLVIVEGLNPAALQALGAEVWRDAGRLRPVHPDAVRLALEAAGFAETRVELLEPPEDRLEGPAPSADPGAETLRLALERLNAVLFGPRRYAVHASR